MYFFFCFLENIIVFQKTVLSLHRKLNLMRIVSFKMIKEFSAIHSDAEIPLCKWFHVTESSLWNNFNDIKKTFSSVDYIGNDRFVFNIKGNVYRLVAIIIFASKKVYIRFIGTHREYDKINCENI